MKPVEISKSVFGRYVVGYNCPYCRERLKSALNNVGKLEACPSCHRQFVVPGEKQWAELQKPKIEEPEIITEVEVVAEPIGQEPPIFATFSPHQVGFQHQVSAHLPQQPLYQDPQAKTGQQAAIAGCFIFTFGFMLLMCGCPLIILTGITSGTPGGSSSSPYSDSSSWKAKNDAYHNTWGHSRDQYDYRSESTYEDRAIERDYGFDPGDITHLRKQLEKMSNR